MADSIREADGDWEETEHGETYFRRKRLSAATDAEALGASLYELPPGKRSWPFHFHTANEEALYGLAGSGTVRLDDDEIALDPGTFVSLPVGEAGGHRVVNTGAEPLRYLCLSTMREPDVTVYPESEKIGVFAGSPPGGDPSERTVGGYFQRESTVDYWEGEDR
ncbi:cupin domain-containing protein [Haloarchaeobius sp. DFWS5]|uniref:cupin domain-containing protein n=1 Tax=Haloarchaeobius sp. DFWS5 TaxID=3446114 RepID=UPI003EBED331